MSTNTLDFQKEWNSRTRNDGYLRMEESYVRTRAVTLRELNKRRYERQKVKYTICDIGGGNGGTWFGLDRIYQDVDFINIDADQAELDKATKAGMGTYLADMENAHWTTYKLDPDVVVLSNILEHDVNCNRNLANIVNAVAIGTKFIIVSPNVRTVQSLIRMVFQNLPPVYGAHYPNPHYRDFTTKSMAAMAREAGLVVDYVQGCEMLLPGTMSRGFVDKLGKYLPASWNSMFIMVCTKINPF